MKNEKTNLEMVEYIVRNGYCVRGEEEKIIFPSTQNQISEIAAKYYKRIILQSTVSNCLAELNFIRDRESDRYKKKSGDLYKQHHIILIKYLKLMDFEVQISKTKDQVTIMSDTINVDLLYELILESYPKGYIKYILKGYNILKVAVDNKKLPSCESSTCPTLLSDLKANEKIFNKPLVIERTKD